VSAIQATTISTSNILLHDRQTAERPRAKHEAQSIKEVCTAFRRVYPTVLQGLETVEPQSSDGKDLYVPGLSGVVKVFQAFLGRLHKFALDEFVRREHEVTSKRRGSGFRPEETQKMFSQGHSPTSVENLDTAKDLIRVLVGMITALDVSKDAHCQLLEGYLCAILDHIGSSLSLLVFADSDPSRKKQAGLLPPTGILDMVQPNVDSATGSATIEGPYVVFILRKGVDFLLANAARIPETSLPNFALDRSDGKPPGGSQGLRRKIEETLQNTLLRGAFGDDDDTFCNSLRRDGEEAEEADLNKMVENIGQKEDCAEWFIGEVWEYLGWGYSIGEKRHLTSILALLSESSYGDMVLCRISRLVQESH